MTKIGWATDTHLDCLASRQRREFYNKIAAHLFDSFIITGDVADSHTAEDILCEMQGTLKIPVNFVLGNHDYYGSSVTHVRRWASKFKGPARWLAGQVVGLSKNVGLVGIDGWADGEHGDAIGSRILLNDWDMIEDFRLVGASYKREPRLNMMQKLAYADAERLEITMESAFKNYDHLVVATHVPPWPQATWHQGRPSDDAWLPWFSSKRTGDAIERAVKRTPGKSVTVLCGHTHGSGTSRISDRIRVFTAASEYGAPQTFASIVVSDESCEINEIYEPR